MPKTNKILCPSAICKEGAQIIGIANSQGMVDIIAKPLPVTAEFVEVAKQGRAAEKRFRFSNTCVEKGCHQWTGKSCGVIEKIVGQLEEIESKIQLPKCGIRKDCRWYKQEGANACHICPYVITDNMEESLL